MVRQWLVRERWALVVGLGLTLAAIVLHAIGVTGPIELLWFDAHVRHFSRIPGSEAIVHIDIGDDALRRIGPWPWPRDVQADLLRILHDLGADRIVMDIVWTDPKPAEVRLPTLEPYAEVEGQVKLLGELSEENVVRPDDELAGAVAEAGNVYLAVYYTPPQARGESPDLKNRIAGLLREDFGLDVRELAERSGSSPEAVERIVAGVKRRVASDRVRAVLEANPSASARQVHEAILTTPFERQTADRTDILAGYHRELCFRRLRSAWPPVPEALKGKLPVIVNVEPPVYKFTAGARGIGSVTFTPDPDGRTRHVPLLMEWEGRLVEQLALAAVREVLDIRLEDLAIDGSGDLVVAARGSRPAMRVQLDGKGQMLVNWHTCRGRWQDCFTHLNSARLLQIRDCRMRIRENEIRRQLRIAEAMLLVMGEEGFGPFRRDYHAMLENERIARLGKLQGRSEAREVKDAEAEARRLREQVEGLQRQALSMIAEEWAELKARHDANDPGLAEDYKRLEAANRLITEDVAELDRINQTIAAEQERLTNQLRPLIDGKICFVGCTASAVADMVTTPAYDLMPGVMVHSNVLNNFLQGQFRGWSDRSMQVTVIALFGVLMTVLTTTRGPRTSLLFMLLAIGVASVLNAWAVFERHDHWLRLLTALGLTFVVWAIIVLLRYLTADRQKRQLRKAVAQYVSPAMARRIGESATRLDLSPVSGEVTCFFSDLRGFTTISENLGPEGTKTVLNPYLEAMSVVLHRHRALINKFMGDGIFAFFNPPILPCDQHEIAACESALESQRALQELRARYADHPLAGEFQRLFMRIGIASGPVFVGDYGSESKLDYTCMGDTVNLAARLESANKQFGSAIMVAGGTRRKAEGRYLCRHLGALQVKGRTVGVPVYELLGRPGEANDETVRFAETFGEAVAAFARRDWARSGAMFERCLELRPIDPGTLRYLDAIRMYRQEPPPDDWEGTLELTEK